MYPYVFLYLVVAFFFVVDRRFIENPFVFWGVFMFVVLFSGLRLDVGVDYKNYTEIFSVLKGGVGEVDAERVEPLTHFFVRIVDLLGFGDQYVFFIFSFITLLGVFQFIRLFSLDRRVSIFVFVCVGIFFFATLNGMRQWLAISFFLMSLNPVLKRNYFTALFFLGCMIASHYTSVLLLFIYPFLFFRFSIFHVLLGFLLAYVMGYSMPYLLAGSVYSIYFNKEFLQQGISMKLLFLYVASMLFFLFYFGYFKKKVCMGREILVLLNMCLASVVVIVVMSAINASPTLMMRLNTYFQIQLIILFSYFFVSLRGRWIYYHIKMAFFILIGTYYFYTLFFNGARYSLTPYALRFS